MLRRMASLNLTNGFSLVLVGVLTFPGCADVSTGVDVIRSPSVERPLLRRHSLSPQAADAILQGISPDHTFGLLPQSATTLGDIDGSVGASSAITCDLGAVACGAIETTRYQWDMLAWASTYKQAPGTAVWLTLDGWGTFNQGPILGQHFYLNCHELFADSCSDTEVFSHTCETEWNILSAWVTHTAGANGQIYVGIGATEVECDDSGSGGGGGMAGGGGGNCTTQTVYIDYWNGSTWVLGNTVQATVCV